MFNKSSLLCAKPRAEHWLEHALGNVSILLLTFTSLYTGTIRCDYCKTKKVIYLFLYYSQGNKYGGDTHGQRD